MFHSHWVTSPELCFSQYLQRIHFCQFTSCQLHSIPLSHSSRLIIQPLLPLYFLTYILLYRSNTLLFLNFLSGRIDPSLLVFRAFLHTILYVTSLFHSISSRTVLTGQGPYSRTLTIYTIWVLWLNFRCLFEGFRKEKVSLSQLINNKYSLKTFPFLIIIITFTEMPPAEYCTTFIREYFYFINK